jgi:PAS domain S-box-containing protein
MNPNSTIPEMKPAGRLGLYMVLVFVMLSAAVVTISLVYYRTELDRAQKAKSTDLASVAKLKVRDIVNWRDARMNDAVFAMGRSRFTDLFDRAQQNTITTNSMRMLTNGMESARQAGGYSSMLLVDVQNALHYKAGVPDLPLPPQTLAMIRMSVESRFPVMGDIRKGNGTNSPRMDVVMPLFNNEGVSTNLLGAAVFQIALEDYLFPTILEWPVASPSSEIQLVRKEGERVVYLSKLKFRSDPPLSLSLPLTDTNQAAVRAAHGAVGIVQGTDYRGVDVLAFIEPVPNTDWFLIAKTDMKEVMADLRSRLQLPILIDTSLIALAGMLVMIVFRTQQRNLYRELYETESSRRALAARYENLVQQSNEAILLLEETGRILESNEMSGKTYGRKPSDMQAMTLLDLCNEASKPGTREALERSRTQPVMFETMHRRSDGGEFPVEVSLNRIQSGGHSYLQCFIRDITDRRRAQEAIQLNEQRALALLNLNNKAGELSEKELTRYVLDEIESLTRSQVSYMHFVEDQKTVRLVSWSSATIGICQAAFDSHYPLEKAGIWADCVRQGKPVIHNDFSASPKTPALPRGHVPLTRHMSVPVIEQGIARLVLGVGNKPVPYTETDQQILQIMANDLWKAINRHRTERTLRQSEQRLANLMSNLPGLVYRCSNSPDRSMEFVSEGVRALTGYAADDIIADKTVNFGSLIHPQDREQIWNLMQSSLASGKSYHLTYRIRHRSGDWRWVWEQGRGNYSETGGLEALEGFISDITERKQAETALREMGDRFRSLFESMLEGVSLNELVFSPDGVPVDYRIIGVNNGFEQILRVRAEDVIGRLASEVYKSTPPPLLADFAAVVNEGKPRRMETHIESMNRFFDISIIPWGKEGFATLFDDITARRLSEAERDRLLHELEDKNHELESIVYVASHDLRSPLVNIHGFSQRLEKAFSDLSVQLSRPEVPAELKATLTPLMGNRIPNALHYVRASSNKMDAIINGLLCLSRAGRGGLKLEQLDMNTMFQNILDAMKYQTQRCGAEIVKESLPSCWGDLTHINQVFSNLLDNAIKYRDPERELRIRITGRIEGKWSVYSVADTGRGIATEHQRRIWELFHRLDPQGSEPGEGIGLTLARRIVERHQGEIQVESTSGVGSTFHVKLPTHPPLASAAHRELS